MTPITKQQIEELIDRLASKELTFGCKVAIQTHTWMGGGIIVGYFYEDYGSVKGFKVLNGDGMHKVYRDDIKKVLGHPILIGDVLEKMRDMNREGFQGYEAEIKLLELWGVHSLTTSLQEYFEKCEFDEDGEFTMRYNQGFIDQKDIRELFQFLLQLGL